ncbi:MAG: VWA domain-containing protein [Hyphomicrobiaceae bacterium]
MADKSKTQRPSVPTFGGGNRPVTPHAEEQTAPADLPSSAEDVAAFIAAVKARAPVDTGARGRLMFAMDATMSRQPTWDMALQLQSDMFATVRQVGGLDVQLVYFRGAGECRASKWVSDPASLARLMTTVSCAGGYTQIAKVLSHARQEAERRRVSAVVYVGDCMEEDVDDLCGRAGELALLGVPMFLFQEGHDMAAERAFREIARLTKGAFCRFDVGAAAQLRELLTAVAVYAAGGRKALEALSERQAGGARLLLEQMR